MDWRGSGMKRTNSDEALSSMTGDVDARGQIYPAKIQHWVMWLLEVVHVLSGHSWYYDIPEGYSGPWGSVLYFE
ncbi:hypothetical protein QQ045_013377 [Rhodiola kirilowii]